MKRLLSCLLALGMLTGCMTAPVVPPIGMVYTNFEALLDIDYSQTDVSGKMGTSESFSILGLVAIGDASAAATADNASIDTIEHADYEFFNVLGVYQRYRTVVYGD